MSLYFLTQFLGLDGPYLALLGPLLAPPGNSLDLPESGLDLISTKFRFFCFATSKKSYLVLLPCRICFEWLQNHDEKSVSKFCISQLRRRAKRSS